jgi:hypothetical protein
MADGTEPTDSSSGDLALEPPAPPTGGRTRALWGVLAVVAVAAGALAISSGGGDGAPRLPIGLGASGQREAAGAMAADMSLAWVTYVAGDELPSLGGEAAAYRVVADVGEGSVADLAAALGLSGEPVLDGSTWRLEADGTYLEVDAASGTWWYTANSGPIASGGSSSGGGSAGCEPGPAVDCAFSDVGTAIEDQPATTVVECQGGDDCLTAVPEEDPCAGDERCQVDPAAPCPPDADCIVPETTIPAPPVDLPSEDEARRIALDLLAGTGVDVDDAKVTVDGPYDAWFVTVEPRLGGKTVSGWLSSVGVGSEGEITSASGTLGSPEELGDYPLLDTRAAIDRLNELQGGGVGGVMPMETADDAAVRAGASAESGAAAVAQCAAPPPGSSATECDDTIACKVQPDGREICEVPGTAPGTDCVTILPEPAPEPGCQTPPECLTTTLSPDTGVGTEPAVDVVEPCDALPCPSAVPPVATDDADQTATTIADDLCVAPEPVPYPEPEPTEVVLTEAEQVLVLSPAVDGSGRLYLVPGYRFSNADGHLVEVVAVADDSLAPTTTVPETPVTEPGVDPGDCEVLTEEDASGSTHTVQSCPDTTLPPQGEELELGVGYYVDVDVECGAFELGGEIWTLEQGDLTGWSTPHEGGTFTLDAPDHGTFVGDADGTKQATFATGIDGNGCQPAPRG